MAQLKCGRKHIFERSFPVLQGSSFAKHLHCVAKHLSLFLTNFILINIYVVSFPDLIVCELLNLVYGFTHCLMLSVLALRPAVAVCSLNVCTVKLCMIAKKQAIY